MPIPAGSPGFSRFACRWRTEGGWGRGGTGLVVVGREEKPINRAVSTYNHIAGRSSSREFESAMTSRSSFKGSDKYAQKTGKIRGRGGWFHLARRLN